MGLPPLCDPYQTQQFSTPTPPLLHIASFLRPGRRIPDEDGDDTGEVLQAELSPEAVHHLRQHAVGLGPQLDVAQVALPHQGGLVQQAAHVGVQRPAISSTYNYDVLFATYMTEMCVYMKITRGDVGPQRICTS